MLTIIGQPISKSLFGQICVVQSTATKKKYIVKISHRADALLGISHEDGVVDEDIQNEAFLLTEIKDSKIAQNLPGYQHICHTLGFRANELYANLFLEYCPKGDLFNYINTHDSSLTTIRRFFKQILLGVEVIHTLGICHLDLSLENLLITADNCIKICDFGLAKKGGLFSQASGKLYYVSPRMLRGKTFNGRWADMWSLGVILFMMLTNSHPYEVPIISDPGFHKIARGEIKALLLGVGYQYTSRSKKNWVPGGAVHLLEALLNTKKPPLSVQEALQHQWLL